jgi:hypothetical protein
MIDSSPMKSKELLRASPIRASGQKVLEQSVSWLERMTGFGAIEPSGRGDPSAYFCPKADEG